MRKLWALAAVGLFVVACSSTEPPGNATKTTQPPPDPTADCTKLDPQDVLALLKARLLLAVNSPDDPATRENATRLLEVVFGTC